MKSSMVMRGLMINKKGAAHFEMIFSFVFFVGFVFFLFIVLKPQDTQTLSGSVIAALYDSFEEEVHTNLSNMFLKTNYTAGGSCFVIELPGRIFTYALNDGDSYVTTLAGAGVDSDLSSSGGNGNLEVNNDSNFFRVSISPEFEDEELDACNPLNDYELGSILERRVVSFSALEAMSDRYRTNYEGLRTDLRLPAIFDFAIVVENMPGIVMEPQSGIPDSVDVMAQDYVIEVLDSSGKLTNERFTLKVW
jgi:hypothetical protein